jgi:hypothetical protein
VGDDEQQQGQSTQEQVQERSTSPA